MDILTAVKIDPETARQSERRKNWALLAMAVGGIMMTIIAAVAMYLISGDTDSVFWLGLAAHVEVLVVLTGFSGLIVKRSLKLDKTGVQIVDHQSDDLIERKDAEEAVENVPSAGKK